MRLLSALKYAFLSLLLVASAHAAPAGSMLAVVRFNQPHVYFDSALKMAVAKALEIKPTTDFTLVQVLPDMRNANSPLLSKKATDANLAKVAAAVRGQGVAESHLKLLREYSAGVQWDEVQVWVQ